VPLFTTMCIWKFEKLSSKTHNSSTVFDKGRYETEERNTDRSKEHHAVFNMWDACIKLSGQCKRHCGEDQYRIAYCARHTVDCCMKRCKPVENSSYLVRDFYPCILWYKREREW
uniref:Beta-defensin n=1 Tax=Loxodonta africana TaxID=9785 RepID=G3THH2_LOXAF